MKSLNKILNYTCYQVPVNIAVITTPYRNEPFLLYILSYLYFIDFVYKRDSIWPIGTSSGEVHGASCVRVHFTGNLYHLSQELNFLYKKKQIPNERIYRVHVECASQWQGVWLCVETAIDMKLW